MRDARPHTIFVSGLSGSGKTTVMAALEDLGFYCADNLPVQLVGQFLDLCAKATPPLERVAMAIDAREGPLVAKLPETLHSLRDSGGNVELLFLEAGVRELMNRYRETRRVHPHARSGQLAVGIESERELLAGVAAQADRLIDTSGLNVHELRTLIFDHVSGTLRRLGVRLISFGFRYGTPGEAELLFDARFLANPYFEETLRECTGRDPEVARFVLEGDTGREFLNRLREWLAFLLPQYDAEGKPFLTLAVGCTGGRHRSVAVVEALASTLREQGRSVSVDHRDLEKRH